MTGWDEVWDDGVGGFSAATQLPAVFLFSLLLLLFCSHTCTCFFFFAVAKLPSVICVFFFSFFLRRDGGAVGGLCKPFPVYCSDTLENCLFLFFFFFAAKYLPFLSVFLGFLFVFVFPFLFSAEVFLSFCFCETFFGCFRGGG